MARFRRTLVRSCRLPRLRLPTRCSLAARIAAGKSCSKSSLGSRRNWGCIDLRRLGPPLPGDIGRPVPGAQASGPGAVDPEQQRIAQEAEAARTSHLFATTSTREQPAAPAAPAADQKIATPTGQMDVPPLDPESLLNMQ